MYKDGSQSEVKNYLLNRGINEETIKTFQIGFAPKGWDNLSTFFKKNLDPELQKVDGAIPKYFLVMIINFHLSGKNPM